MPKKREKKVIHTGVSPEQMELAFADYARCDALIQKTTAQMDIEITKIRKKYADDISKNTEARDNAFEVLQAFACENRDTLFIKKKSMETTHGTIGFRTSTPTLKTLKGFTWASVTKLLKKSLPAYVRTKEEPDKERLLSDRKNEKVSAMFQEVGITVVQDETFFVEPKKEE